jgi:daunorubicin/doxorubicin transport system ATP-binding protein
VWEIIRALVADRTTVLLTTQYLEEADQLADRIAVIDHGRVIAEGTSGQLKASLGSGALHVRLGEPERRADAERVLTHALGVGVHLELTRRRCRRRSPIPDVLAARCPTSAAPKCPWSGSRSANPAWTRCSSP